MAARVGPPEGLTGVFDAVSRLAGSRWTASAVAAAITGYLIVGAVTGFDHWWQTSVHSVAALVTLPMLFVLQHTTNRHTSGILIKLDELIKTSSGAEDRLIDLEEMEVTEQEEIHEELHHGTDGGGIE